MKKIPLGLIVVIPSLLMAFVLGFIASRAVQFHPPPTTSLPMPPTNTRQAIAQAASPTSSETLLPNTPLATFTPSRTLKPPPTLQRPTATLPPSQTPINTATPTLDLSVSIPGLQGAESATPVSTAECKPRKEWKLTYTVQRNDALARIAELYKTTVQELTKGNCLKDGNVIVIGQVLKVPGTIQPVIPEVECVPFDLLTPRDGTLDVSGGGILAFDWHGPRAPFNLIRIFRPNGSKFEVVNEYRQNELIDLDKNLPAGGTYTWYIFPLNKNFVQVCPEGGPWKFTKAQAPPTATPTPTSTP